VPLSAALAQDPPAQSLAGAQPSTWEQGFLPRLRDTDASCLFAGSNNSEAEYIYQRHRHTYTGAHRHRDIEGTLTWLVTHAAKTRHCPQHIQHPHTRHTKTEGWTAKSPSPHGLAETEGH